MRSSENNTPELRVPGISHWIEVVTLFVRKGAEAAGYGEKEQSYYELAAEEIFSGLFLRGNQGNPVSITLEESPLGMKVLFLDQGIPLDFEEMPLYDPGALKDSEAGEISGLQLFLVRNLMDEVAFENRGLRGREVRMLRYRAAHIPSEEAPPEKHAPEHVVPESWAIRSMRPEDALGISRCAWTAYGYSYFEHIYYPQRIVELNAHRKVHSLVAVTGEGEIMGHAWLFFPPGDTGIAEMGGAFVDPRFRGLGCLSAFSRSLQEKARELGLAGVFVESVTAHPYSQKPVHHQGFKDCLLFLAKISKVDFKNIREEEPQRVSLLVSFRFFSSPEPRRVFFPPRHRAMLERIYAHLEIPREPFSGESPPSRKLFEGHTELEVQADMQYKIANLWIYRYGSDAEKEFYRTFRGLCYEAFVCFYLYLPLNVEETAAFVSEAEKHGFFFAGVLPGSDTRDWLVLQYLREVPLDYEEIICNDPFGEKLREYVRTVDPEAELRRAPLSRKEA